MFEHLDITQNLPKLVCKNFPTGRKYVTEDGKAYPSITNVLGKTSDKTWLYEWRKRVGEEEANRISRQATTNGTRVHKLAEDYLNNEEINSYLTTPYMQAVFSCIQKAFLDVDVVYGQEIALYSRFLSVAGRCDCAAKYRGKNSVLDFKTSRSYKSREDIGHYFIQACAYSIMIEELTQIPVPQLVIVMFVAGESEPSIFIEKRDRWWPELKDRIDTFYKLEGNK